MSTKLNKISKPSKIARYGIDMLVVYSSNNEAPISMEEALARAQRLYGKKNENEKPHIRKCKMQIWRRGTNNYTVVIKTLSGKQVLESFSIDSIGTPQVGQIATQCLVFLPVLNKNYKSELFVFHPNTATAQEIVIKLVELMQFKDIPNQQSLPKSSPSPPKSDQGEIISRLGRDFVDTSTETKKEQNGNPDLQREFSPSSSFFNNWYLKIENMVNTAPNTLYHGCCCNHLLNGNNDELVLLNQYLKEIRSFMNNLYSIMFRVANETLLESGHHSHLFKLPPKDSFIDVVQKIKAALNTAAAHEALISNPSAVEIVNQLMLILRIIADATKEKQLHQPDLLRGVINPRINDPTVRYLSENLDHVNKEFWMKLGENYGHEPRPSHINPYCQVIDEFQVRRDLASNGNAPNHYKSHDLQYDIKVEKGEPRHDCCLDRHFGRNFIDQVDIDYERKFDKRVDKHSDRRQKFNHEKIHDFNHFQREDRDYDKSFDTHHFNKLYNSSVNRSYETNLGRQDYTPNIDLHHLDDYRSKDNKHYDSDSDNLFYFKESRKNLSLSQPQLYYPKTSSVLQTHDDDLTYRSYPPFLDSEKISPFVVDTDILLHQQGNDTRSHNGSSYLKPKHCTWNDRQCRFIDAVQLRNGRLMKITRDRPAQNKREISVAYNEIVEWLSDHKDMFSVKNSFGEVGYCPQSIVEQVTTPL